MCRDHTGDNQCCHIWRPIKKHRASPRVTDAGAFSAQYVVTMSIHAVVSNQMRACLLVPAGARAHLVTSSPPSSSDAHN